jgi:plastocyanin
MNTDLGIDALWIRRAALGVAAVIGVTACSAPSSSGTHPVPQQGAPANMAQIATMAGTTATSAAGPASPSPPPARKGDVQVRIVNFSFSPATVTIRAGQTVAWTNRDSVAHTVDLSGVISNVLNRGDTYGQRFTSMGTYTYICSIHPFMHGTVVVTS